MKVLITCFALSLMADSLPQSANAGDIGEAARTDFFKPAIQSDFPFQKGTKEVHLLDGIFVSWEFSSVRRPSFDYELTCLRVGYMLTNVKYSGWLRGNYEFLLEGFVGPFYQGQGTALGGLTFQGRYNFVQPNARLIPYFQIGAGGLYNDAYHHTNQIEIGSGLEFNLQSTLGLSYLLTGNWALSAEFGYRHISDAETSTRNAGVNSLGGLLGLSYFF